LLQFKVQKMHFTLTGWYVQRAGAWHFWLFESI